MSNNAAGLNGFIDTALREKVVDDTWTSAEKDNVIAWAVARLWPRFAKIGDPTVDYVAMTSGTYFYNAPSGVKAISRLDVWDAQPGSANATQLMSVNGRNWETVGDPYTGTMKIHLQPQIPVTGQYLGVIGYSQYDVASNLIPDALVPLVLAMARHELYRRLAADRQRFKDWLTRNQDQNVSINELMQLINEAEAESNALWRTIEPTPMKPVPGRVG